MISAFLDEVLDQADELAAQFEACELNPHDFCDRGVLRAIREAVETRPSLTLNLSARPGSDD
jgi:hypothetical protein